MQTKTCFFSCLFLLFLLSCKDETQITQIIAPEDYRPPLVVWLTPPETDIRGTIALDVSVTDSSRIAEVKLYIDGREAQTLTSSPYRFEVITDSLSDGVHLFEVRALDEFGNLGISPILRANVMNSYAQNPQLLWVPDDYSTIQAAINAATDFDTIRVRDGVYLEALNTFGKGFWIESEHGPIHCIINANGSNSCFTVSPCQIIGTIRGFQFTGGEFIVRYVSGAQYNIYNCIFQSDTASGLLGISYGNGEINNNYFSGSDQAVYDAYHWGTFYNNVLMNCIGTAFFNGSVARNLVTYGYCLFWSNGQDYDYFDPGQGDLHVDPLIDLSNGRLIQGSPAIDAGNPDIIDRDSTHSDIGPFGGPYSY